MQCKAKSKSTGKQCQQPAIQGGTVCRFHGGGAPNVIEAARRRLACMLVPALGIIERTLKRDSEARDMRIWRIKKRMKDLQQVIDERAKDKSVAKAPGGKTGHVVMRKKAVGMLVVEEYQVDVGLLEQMAKLEDQLRIEERDASEAHAVAKDLMDRLGLVKGEKPSTAADRLDELIAASKSAPPTEEDEKEIDTL